MQTSLPEIRSSGDHGKELFIDGLPFIMLAGELQNSSFSSSEYMKGVWPQLLESGLNTVLGPVTWEQTEPNEGQFDFTELDEIIRDARSHGLKLVLLWFGAYKNASSDYVPSWVKSNSYRFTRARIVSKEGALKVTRSISLFGEEIAKSDERAFAAFMKHCKEVNTDNTVIMVQVENEVGIFGDARDRCDLAEKAFNSPVPLQLLNFLDAEKSNLTSDLHKFGLANYSFDASSSAGRAWQDTFGDSPSTDELFMAYHFAIYVERLAATGKAIYPLPLYTNAALNVGESDHNEPLPEFVVAGGDRPGFYFSGGPIYKVIDVWQHFAPSLELLAPDIYLSDYEVTCARYRHRGQPLFIPEQRRDDYGARRVWSALATHHALGVAPFGIDTLTQTENPWIKTFGLLRPLLPLLAKYRSKAATYGFFFDELSSSGGDPSPPRKVTFGCLELTIARAHVFGKPSAGCGMVVHLGGTRFLLVGWGFQVSFSPVGKAASIVGISRFVEKQWRNGALRDLRWLNGDESRSGKYAVMPADKPDYGQFPIPVAIPAHTYIAEVEAYLVEEQQSA